MNIIIKGTFILCMVGFFLLICKKEISGKKNFEQIKKHSNERNNYLLSIINKDTLPNSNVDETTRDSIGQMQHDSLIKKLQPVVQDKLNNGNKTRPKIF